VRSLPPRLLVFEKPIVLSKSSQTRHDHGTESASWVLAHATQVLQSFLTTGNQGWRNSCYASVPRLANKRRSSAERLVSPSIHSLLVVWTNVISAARPVVNFRFNQYRSLCSAGGVQRQRQDSLSRHRSFHLLGVPQCDPSLNCSSARRLPSTNAMGTSRYLCVHGDAAVAVSINDTNEYPWSTVNWRALVLV